MKPTIGKRAFVPMRHLDRATCKVAQSALRFKEKQMQLMDAILHDQEDDSGEENYTSQIVTVNEYVERLGGVSFPRNWALQRWPNLDWQDNTLFPTHKIKFNGGPTPRDDQQRVFFEKLEADALLPGPQDILANADTGAGKSVAGIWLGQQLKARTLIIVDQNKLANGWLENMNKFYGKEWVSKNVGRVQQDKCEFEDKAFSIGLLQSIVSRDYGRKFREAFGLVIFDEVQIYGTAAYVKALSMFKARVRVGFTAENRGGSFGRMIKAHLGNTRIVSAQEVMQPTAYLIKNTITQTFYCQTDGAIISGLARLHDRNANLARLIKRKGYDRGRQVLVLSERTAHLVELRQRCIALGVPADSMGLHMGTYISGRTEVVYHYSENGNKYSVGVFDTIAQARDAIKALKKGESELALPLAVQKKMLKDPKSVMFSLRKETYVPSQEELDNITNSCQIVFATKQIFSKGVNVPRLDMGVEALPLGNLKQPLGRILRVVEGKAAPEWYAICDEVELEGLFKNSGDPSANLLNTFLRMKSTIRLAALKRSKAKLVKA